MRVMAKIRGPLANVNDRAMRRPAPSPKESTLSTPTLSPPASTHSTASGARADSSDVRPT